MNTRQLISKFVAQLCEKQYAYANSTLASIVEAKLAIKIKKEADKASGKSSKKTTMSKKENQKRFLDMVKKKKSTKKGSGKDK